MALKFKNIDKITLLDLVEKFIDQNGYNCAPEYVSFSDWCGLNISYVFQYDDVIRYFEHYYFDKSTLKLFYKTTI